MQLLFLTYTILSETENRNIMLNCTYDTIGMGIEFDLDTPLGSWATFAIQGPYYVATPACSKSTREECDCDVRGEGRRVNIGIIMYGVS